MVIINKKAKSIVILVLLAAALGACVSTEQKGLKPSDDWSKGAPIGESVIGSLGFVVEPEGDAIHLVWPTEMDTGFGIYYERLNQQAQPVFDSRIDLKAARLRAPRLVRASEGRLHLFWESREESGAWHVRHALLGEDGTLIGDQSQISTGNLNVEGYEATPRTDGGAIAVWDTANGGVYAIQMDPSGEPGDPVQISMTGNSPSARVADDGSIHLAWFEGTELRYAEFPDGQLAPTEGVVVENLLVSLGDTINGPVVGLSDGWVYILWSKVSRAGLLAGQAQTMYDSFPRGSPEVALPSNAKLIPILTSEEQPYEPYDGIFSLSQLVPQSAATISSEYTNDPQTLKQELGELAVVVSTNQAYRQDEVVQIAVLVFDDGEFKGYSFASKSPTYSGSPIIDVDDSGNIFVAWREGGAGDKVFLSTTQPIMGAAIDRIRTDDLVNTALQGGIEGAATILLFPLAIPWVVPGYILLGIWKIFRDYESLANRSSWVVLVIAIALYELTKLLFLPTVLDYVPFSAWIDIPDGMANPLRILFPVISLGLGVALAEVVRRRRDSQSTLLYYTLIVFTDLLITLAVYGVAYLGVL